MLNNNITLSVVVHGPNGDLTAREFLSPLDRQTYIEGREGSNYSLRLRNSNPFRVGAIVSVDGLSILDGEPAGQSSPSYILEAHQTLDIPGFVVDGGTAAKFQFSGLKGDSYAEASGNTPLNKGFIGVQAFREDVPVRSYGGNARVALAARSPMFGGGIAKGLYSPSVSLNVTDDSFYDGSAGFASHTMSSSATLNNMAVGSASASATSFNATHEGTATMDWMEQEQERSRGIMPEVEQTLGTKFGEAVNFETTKVEFKRGDLISMMILKYDDARGLKKRGIDIHGHRKPQPSAFPADAPKGCRPPAGWNR